MKIAIAGPYSAPTEAERKKNLDAMNSAGAQIYKMGHIPVIGMNAALLIAEQIDTIDKYKIYMDISLAVVGDCDALLVIGMSPGVKQEMDLMMLKGKKIYFSIGEIPLSK